MTSTVGATGGGSEHHEPHRRRREQRARLAFKVSLASQAAATVTTLAVVAFAARHLGSERYGMWLAVTSVVALMNASDLGVGNDVLTRVAAADGRDDSAAAQRVASSGLVALLAATAFLAVVGGSIVFALDWPTLLGVETPNAVRETRPTVLAAFIMVLVATPASLAGKVRAGLQESHYNAGWNAVGSLATVVTLPLLAVNGAGTLTLALVLLGIPIAASLGNAIQLFGRQHRELRPSLRCTDWEQVRSILGSGSWFMAIQISAAVSFSTDNIIIGRLFGAATILSYGVAAKGFAIAQVVIAFVLVPLWAAYREALSRGDVAWIRSKLRRSIRAAGAIALLFAVPALIIGAPIIEWWAGPEARPSTGVLTGLAVWVLISGIGGAIGVLLNGLERIRLQAALATVMAVINVPISIAFAHRFGVAGPIWGTIVAYLLAVAMPLWTQVPRLLRSLGSPQ